MAALSFPGAVKSIFSAASGGLFLSVSTVFRRGYVATSEGVKKAGGLSKVGCSGVMVGKIEQRAAMRVVGEEEVESTWAPDPLTGYYRPSNRAAEIDPVQLRDMLLKTNPKSF